MGIYRDYYQHILATTPQGLERDVFNYLIEHDCIGRDAAIPVDTLAYRVIGRSTSTSIRQVRLAIGKLRTIGVPVLAGSDSRGRWLAGSQQEINAFLTETQHRMNELREIYNGISRSTLPIEVPDWDNCSIVHQPNLL